MEVKEGTPSIFAQRFLTLSSGSRLPIFGLGTYRLKDEACKNSVGAALSAGYRLIDTARSYRNETEIGHSIRESGIPREEIFITTKIPPTQQGEMEAYECLKDSLADLKTDYVDLALIHWPGVSKVQPESEINKIGRLGSWKALMRARAEGLVRDIGVSNFTQAHLEELKEEGLEIPSLNQVELHPLCTQNELRAYCLKSGIIVQAYSSLGEGSPVLLENENLVSVAGELNTTVPLLLLAWAIKQNIPVIPKSATLTRIQLNLQAIPLSQILSSEQVERISAINRDHHFCWNPHSIK